jgi:hypothetical protein
MKYTTIFFGCIIPVSWLAGRKYIKNPFLYKKTTFWSSGYAYRDDYVIFSKSTIYLYVPAIPFVKDIYITNKENQRVCAHEIFKSLSSAKLILNDRDEERDREIFYEYNFHPFFMFYPSKHTDYAGKDDHGWLKILDQELKDKNLTLNVRYYFPYFLLKFRTLYSFKIPPEDGLIPPY